MIKRKRSAVGWILVVRDKRKSVIKGTNKANKKCGSNLDRNVPNINDTRTADNEANKDEENRAKEESLSAEKESTRMR